MNIIEDGVHTMCYHDPHTPHNQLNDFGVLYSNICLDLQQILILIQINPLYIATKIVRCC